MSTGFSDATTTAIDTARSYTVGDLLRRTALRAPTKTALINGDTSLTFAEFDAAVNRCANALTAHGLAKGDRLALVSHNCWQFAVLTFASARLGAILVPINFGLGADEIAFILDHSGSTIVVAEDALAGTVGAAIDASSRTDVVRATIGLAGTPVDGWEDIADWITHPDATAPQVLVRDDDPLRMMFTSGTESRPKGVLLSSKSLVSQYVSCIVDGGMTSDDIEIHSLPLYHCAQLDCFLSVDVYLGATSIILPSPEPAALLAAVEAHGATKLFCPPTVWISLLRHPDFDTRDLSSLRKGYYGASPMPVEVLRELGERLPDVLFWNFYGQTEMSPLATILQPHEQIPHAGSAGRASLNVETIVVDDEGNPLPVGQVGEIVHRSPHACLGYYNDEEKTAAAFAGGWFHSGDLGKFDADGYLSVVDRKKDMIKTGGENVASREVEEAIYLLDGVAEVAVFGVPHPKWIEAVTAVVVPKDGVTLTQAHVDAHVESVLAPYKRPKYVIFAEALPKNPSGKILKKNLRVAHESVATG
ncbi:acyl-CoA synthetase [Gordonia sp. (in: high G+C Gram-positive bacteria)]|uniref:acyl-CoA synthetase n=1 Tax=Gordonia sp. (in: high G+C Gram-positive bacteria) TaxID=84139 RepID=UPI0016ACA385|nr:acyl-CoA synthetase [Gordonia sp. (in: high G+C Gram-positive bacteria)]NLG47244.1 acyl-CoA synthetase [Gordonia sp. (in: high G+C Gram-positive bacteria)]